MNILGESKRDRCRTIAILAFMGFVAATIGAVHIFRGVQEWTYRKRVEEFALQAVGYAKTHEFRLSDFGGRRAGSAAKGTCTLLLASKDRELYALRCRVRCGALSARLNAVEVGYFREGVLTGFVDITDAFMQGRAEAPRTYLEHQSDFPTKQEFESELEFQLHPTIEAFLSRARRDSIRTVPASQLEPEIDSPIIRWLGAVTGRQRRFEISETGLGVAMLEGVLLVLILIAFWWLFLRREPPMAWRRVWFHLAWGAVLIGVGAVLCERTYDSLTYRFGLSSDSVMTWACRGLLAVGFAIYLWHVFEGGLEYARIPADARRPEGGWRLGRVAEASVVTLCIGYVALVIGLCMYDPGRPGPDAMVLWVWGGTFLAAIGGAGLLASIVVGLKELRRPIGDQEPPWARFLVVFLPLFVVLPGAIVMMVAAGVK